MSYLLLTILLLHGWHRVHWETNFHKKYKISQTYFKVSTIEIERADPSYTIDTITELRAGLGANDEIFFIVGWDSLPRLPRWKEPKQLIQMCRLVAVPRPNYSLTDLDSLEAAIPELRQSLIVLDKPRVDVSATDIRKRVAQGLSIDHLVPEAVAEYIKQHRLFLYMLGV